MGCTPCTINVHVKPYTLLPQPRARPAVTQRQLRHRAHASHDDDHAQQHRRLHGERQGVAVLRHRKPPAERGAGDVSTRGCCDDTLTPYTPTYIGAYIEWTICLIEDKTELDQMQDTQV